MHLSAFPLSKRLHCNVPWICSKKYGFHKSLQNEQEKSDQEKKLFWAVLVRNATATVVQHTTENNRRNSAKLMSRSWVVTTGAAVALRHPRITEDWHYGSFYFSQVGMQVPLSTTQLTDDNQELVYQNSTDHVHSAQCTSCLLHSAPSAILAVRFGVSRWT